MAVLTIQRRMMELGRCRLGEKGSKGEPRKLDTFRWTSASRALLEAIAAKDGGQVREWKGAPDEGYFEVTTDASSVDIIIPPVFSQADGTPTTPYSQWYESWSGGGCQRRCDGQTEALSGKPCLCAAKVEADGEDARVCKITTRFAFMRPDVPGLGVWRIESHGWNAAVELPGTLDVLLMAASEHKFIPAVLRAEARSKKQGGQTRRYVVPVIDLPGVTVQQLTTGEVPTVLNPPAAPSRDRPALPAGPPPPDESGFGRPEAEHGPPPDLPKTGPAPVGGTQPEESSPSPPAASGASTTTDAEAQVRPVLELATRVGKHTETVDAISAYREKHGGVDARFLAKLSQRLLELQPEPEPEAEQSQFEAMVPQSARRP